MAGLTNLLYTARDAIAAQTYGVSVAGQNIANVNTPGYARREAILATRALGDQATGSVQVLGTRRLANVYAQERHFEATGLSSAAGERDRQLEALESVFNDVAGTGLGGDIDRLFSSFSVLAGNPADPTLRAQVLDAAQALASSMNRAGDFIGKAREDIYRQAEAETAELNQKAADIAKLNTEIAAAEANGQDAADLKDQRNRLLLDMADKVNLRTFTNGAGSLVVQAGGATLVDGGEARSLSVGLAADGSLQYFAHRTGGPPTEITAFVNGGTLAGLREARDVDMVAAANRLDQLAYDVATAVNTQHAAGYGLDGVGNRNLFAPPTGVPGAARALAVSTDVAGAPNRIAASGSAATVPGGSDNAYAMSALAEQLVASGGTRRPAQAYSDLVGDIGSRKAHAERDVQVRGAIEAQSQAIVDEASGVSLEEEMISLTKYQHAYEAASRVLATVDELFQELLQVVR